MINNSGAVIRLRDKPPTLSQSASTAATPTTFLDVLNAPVSSGQHHYLAVLRPGRAVQRAYNRVAHRPLSCLTQTHLDPSSSCTLPTTRRSRPRPRPRTCQKSGPRFPGERAGPPPSTSCTTPLTGTPMSSLTSSSHPRSRASRSQGRQRSMVPPRLMATL